jgi:hypothetical protein
LINENRQDERNNDDQERTLSIIMIDAKRTNNNTATTMTDRHPKVKPTSKSTTSTKSKNDRDRLISRRAVEGMIAEGHIIVVYEGQVLNLDGWMDKHPGGKLPLMHMIGVEAGSEINA